MVQSDTVVSQDTPFEVVNSMSCVTVRLVSPTWPVEVTVHFTQAVPPLLSHVGGVDCALRLTVPRPRE